MKNLKDIEKDIFEVNARLKHIQEDVARLQEKPKKKQLPKSKVEFSKFLINYNNDNDFVCMRVCINDFLKDYED
jgi:hypothetical protein